MTDTVFTWSLLSPPLFKVTNKGLFTTSALTDETSLAAFSRSVVGTRKATAPAREEEGRIKKEAFLTSQREKENS